MPLLGDSVHDRRLVQAYNNDPANGWTTLPTEVDGADKHYDGRMHPMQQTRPTSATGLSRRWVMAILRASEPAFPCLH